MCRSKADGGRRCNRIVRWFVNCEYHPQAGVDSEQERHWFKPLALLSMKAGAIRQRRLRAKQYAAEVEAIRVVKGVAPGEPIGAVLREELWEHRRLDGGLTLLAMHDRARAVAEHEGIDVEDVVDRFNRLEIRPSRQRVGEALARDVVEDQDNPAWIDPDRLAECISRTSNGDVDEVYVDVVTDGQGAEFVLVRSYDNSAAMAWPHTLAGRKGAAEEALDRLAALNQDRSAYDAWLDAQDLRAADAPDPWTQSMSDADFLSLTGNGGMHLV